MLMLRHARLDLPAERAERAEPAHVSRTSRPCAKGGAIRPLKVSRLRPPTCICRESLSCLHAVKPRALLKRAYRLEGSEGGGSPQNRHHSNRAKKQARYILRIQSKDLQKSPKCIQIEPYSANVAVWGHILPIFYLEKISPKPFLARLDLRLVFGSPKGLKTLETVGDHAMSAEKPLKRAKNDSWISNESWRSRNAGLNAVLDLRTDLEILENARGGCSVMEWQHLREANSVL